MCVNVFNVSSIRICLLLFTRCSNDRNKAILIRAICLLIEHVQIVFSIKAQTNIPNPDTKTVNRVVKCCPFVVNNEMTIVVMSLT